MAMPSKKVPEKQASLQAISKLSKGHNSIIKEPQAFEEYAHRRYFAPARDAANHAIFIKQKLPMLIAKGLIDRELAEQISKEMDELLRKYRNGMLSEEDASRFLEEAQQFMQRYLGKH